MTKNKFTTWGTGGGRGRKVLIQTEFLAQIMFIWISRNI